jgi:hypothetical protein
MRGISMFALAVLFSATTLMFAAPAATHESVMEEFSVKEYEDFHRVLHPLQHEALPKKDFQRIRARAGELTKLGKTITKLGVPRGTPPESVAEFKKELKKFGKALVEFSADAKSGTDPQLEKSYSSVHDSFEMLAVLLPRDGAQVTYPKVNVVVYDGIATQVSAAVEPSSDLWVTMRDLTRATRFVVKPQGVCRDLLCFPLPSNRKAEFIAKRGSTTWFNLSEFARLIKQPFASDQELGVWYFGPLTEERNSYIASLTAPDFTLPDLNGRAHSLKEFRGKKVLLVTWASW